MLTLITLTVFALIIFGLLCYGLCRKVSNTRPSLDSVIVVKHFYQEQIRELNAAVMDNESSQHQVLLRQELQQRLLAESVSEGALGHGKPMPMRFVICVLALSLPLFMMSLERSGVVEWWKTLEAEHDGLARLLQKTPRDFAIAVTSPETLYALQAELQQVPAQSSRWYALGLAWQRMGNMAYARTALEQAWRQAPLNQDYLLAYAQSRFLWEQGYPQPETMALLEAILVKAPQEPHALVLAGMGAFRLGDDAKAVVLLRRFLALPATADLVSDPALVQEIKTVLSKIDARRVPVGAAMHGPFIPVTVRWKPGSVQTLSSQALVYVVVRQPGQRGGLPLALIKRPAREIPFSLAVDASSLVADPMSLPKEVLVSARISVDGSASLSRSDIVSQVVPTVWQKQREAIVLELGE